MREFEKTLKKIGEIAGVGADWYEVGDAETIENGETRYGIYAKTDEIAEKVQAVFDKIIANYERNTDD